jgi:predicted TIM-barrel fold metal-dependent hydrolase
MWEDVLAELAGRDNVYFDTAMAATMGLPPELARKIIAAHSADNIMLGSDCPWEDPARSVQYVVELGLSDALTEKILCGNALSLLHAH